MVSRYVTAETTKASAAQIRFHKVNFFSVITCKCTTKNLYLCKNYPSMAQQDWKDRLGVVYSTNPDFQYQTAQDAPEADTLAPEKQRLVVRIDRRRRAGKQVTLVDGFVGRAADLAALAKTLKTKCGVGGTVEEGQILIQGDLRDKLVTLLSGMGYQVKRGN